MKTEKAKPRRDSFQSPKGMRDVIGDEFYALQGFFEKAAETAVYYGFTPIEPPLLEDEELFVRGVGEETDIVEKELYTLRTKGGDRLALRPEYTAGVMRAYLENGMQSLPQPVMLYSFGNVYRHDKPQRGRSREIRQFNLEVIGTEKPIADAMVVKIFLSILEEAGIKNANIHINSIGDKICRPNYRRELVAYYRRHLGDVCADCVRRFKNNPLRLLDCKNEKCRPIKEKAPNSVSYLCEPCKRHFKEVLEYLESMGIDYDINKNLVRGLDYYSRTVFEVDTPLSKTETEPLSLGGGGRYDYLARQLGSPRDISAVGVGIGADRVVQSPDWAGLSPRIIKKPKIFFIQLGFEAKLRSIEVIETLRRAKIPIHHSLSKDLLGVQLGTAERLGIPYIIILGQKEVTEGTVIVRNMETRSQQTVKLKDLPEYLKKIK